MNATHTLGGDATVQERWIGIGHSGDADAQRAGRHAADGALIGQDVKLVVVFCSDSYDLDALVREVRARSGDAPLVGCSTAGEIATGGPGDAGVVVMALGGPGFSVSTATASCQTSGLRGAGAEVAECLRELEERPHRVLLLLTDGLAGDQQEIVRGAYGVVGAGVPLVGGCAGDDLKMQATFQMHDDAVLRGAVVAAAIGSDAPLGVGVRHGWRRVGEPLLVTHSADNKVFSLDDRPALDVYLERMGAPAEAREDTEAFTRFALTHPLGLGRRSGEDHVRFIGGADFHERSLQCIAEVPQGATAWFMEGDNASVLEATDAACADALAPLGDHRPLGVLAFDCIARRGILGDQGIQAEVDRVASNAGNAPVAGFYTYGEIARTRGVSGFHNQTLVLLALA